MPGKFLPATAALVIMLNACGGPLPPADPPYLAEAKESLSRGNYWYERGCPREAERFFQEAVSAARLSDDVLLIIRANNSLGAAALASGDLPLAATYLEQALELADATEGRPELDKIMGNLGSLAFKAGATGDAEDFWQKAAEVAESRGASPALHLCNLARLYLNQKRPEFPALAARALAEAQKTAVDSGVKADAANLAGHAALAGGDADAAEGYFQEALELDRKTENTAALAQDTEALGRLRLTQNRPSEAAAFLDRAFFLFLAAGDAEGQNRLYNFLKELSREAGVPKKMTPYDQARQNPESFSLTSKCP